MEAELITFLTNQGLAIGIATFLVYWVTSQMGRQIQQSCENQTKLCENQMKLAAAMDRMVDRLESHDVQAKNILEKVDIIEKRLQ